MAVALAVLTSALAGPDSVWAGLTVLVSGVVLALAGLAAVRLLVASERSQRRLTLASDDEVTQQSCPPVVEP